MARARSKDNEIKEQEGLEGLEGTEETTEQEGAIESTETNKEPSLSSQAKGFSQSEEFRIGRAGAIENDPQSSQIVIRN